MHQVKKTSPLSERLLLAVGGAYLTTLFIAGFLTNFLALADINTGTILLFALASLLSATGILYFLHPVRKEVALPIILMLALSLLSVVKAALDLNSISDRIRELAAFFLGAWPFLFFAQIDDIKVLRGFHRILVAGLWGLSIFGIFQGLFAHQLPQSLFVLRGDDTFALSGSDALRPTGLTGNPIVFSSIMVFALAYFAALWLETRRTRFAWAFLCSFLANYFTYTRASFVLAIPVLLFVWLFHQRFHIKHKIALVASIAIVLGGVQFLLVKAPDLIADLIIVQRLQNATPGDAGSTLEHYRQIQNAKDAILSHPWLGTGIGSNVNLPGADTAIITDGTWWILFLEFGAPLSILIVASICGLLFFLARDVLRRETKGCALAIATLSFHAYLIPANFVDSAILGHISFGLYWAILGLSLGVALTPQPHSRSSGDARISGSRAAGRG